MKKKMTKRTYKLKITIPNFIGGLSVWTIGIILAIDLIFGIGN